MINLEFANTITSGWISSGCPGPPVFYGGFTIVYIRDCAGLSFERSRVQILARADISDSLAPPANSSA